MGAPNSKQQGISQMVESNKVRGDIKEKARLAVINLGDEIKTRCSRPTEAKPQNLRLAGFKAVPIQESGSHELSTRLKVIENDGRVKIKDTASFPNSIHGVVKIYKEDGGTSWGTGIMIGLDLVLTAAHNIYDIKNKKKHEKIEFIPGMNGIQAPFEILKVRDSYIPQEYVEGDRNEDYGILVLETSVGLQTGYFGIHVASKKLIKKKELTLIGYPGDKVVNCAEAKEQWGMKGKAIFDDRKPGQILYMITTFSGQSGSGVYYHHKDDLYYIVGVHVQGGIDGNDNLNGATMITKERFQRIEEWTRIARHKLIISKIDTKEADSSKLKQLDLSKRDIRDEGIEILSNFALPKLQKINLSQSFIGNGGAKEIGRNLTWSRLRELILSRNEICDTGAAAIGANTTWKELTLLYLNNNYTSDEGAIAIAKNDTWTKLEDLDLSRNSLGSLSAKAIGENIVWKNLRVLYLSSNFITDDGAQAIAENKIWTKLEVLNLSNNQIGDRGAEALGQNTTWKQLTLLKLAENRIGDEGAIAIVKNKTWSKLENLYLSTNKIGEVAAKEIGTKNNWNELRILDLSSNHLGNQGAIEIAKNKNWIKLDHLYLSSDQIEETGAASLAANPTWKFLKLLCLAGNSGISAEAQSKVKITSRFGHAIHFEKVIAIKLPELI